MRMYMEACKHSLALVLKGAMHGLPAAQTFLGSPLLGSGPSRAAQLNLANSSRIFAKSSLAAHNFLLAIGEEMGLPGLLFFLWLLVPALVRSWPGAHSLANLKRPIFIALVSICIQGLGLSLQNQKGLWLLVGMALCFSDIPRPSQIDP